MAEYLGNVTSRVPGLPEGWGARVWSDEVLFCRASVPGKYPIAQYPDDEMFYVIDWSTGCSMPTIGPFATITAAIAAWKFTQ